MKTILILIIFLLGSKTLSYAQSKESLDSLNKKLEDQQRQINLIKTCMKHHLKQYKTGILVETISFGIVYYSITRLSRNFRTGGNLNPGPVAGIFLGMTGIAIGGYIVIDSHKWFGKVY